MRIASAALLMAALPVGARTLPSPTEAASGVAVEPNDNRRLAGILRNGILTIHLDARMGEWRPDGDAGPGTPAPISTTPVFLTPHGHDPRAE